MRSFLNQKVGGLNLTKVSFFLLLLWFSRKFPEGGGLNALGNF